MLFSYTRMPDAVARVLAALALLTFSSGVAAAVTTRPANADITGVVTDVGSGSPSRQRKSASCRAPK